MKKSNLILGQIMDKFQQINHKFYTPESPNMHSMMKLPFFIKQAKKGGKFSH